MESPLLQPVPRPFAPIDVDSLTMAFGAGEQFRKMMPPKDSIPPEFYRHTKWNDLFSRWFFTGLPKETEFVAKPGIDKAKALRHIRTIMGSFEPKHEDKEAAVAYLLSLWFDDVKLSGPRGK